jgi:hypothetical protein
MENLTEKSIYISYIIRLKSISKSIKYLRGRRYGTNAIQKEKREKTKH